MMKQQFLLVAAIISSSMLVFSECIPLAPSSQPLNGGAFGQSNMRATGAGNAGPHGPFALVDVFNRTTRVMEDMDPNKYVEQFEGFDGPLRSHFLMHFGERVQRETGRQVNYVIDTQGGQSLDVWLPANTEKGRAEGARHSEFLARLDESGLAPLDFMVMALGEEDSADISRAVDTDGSGVQTVQGFFDELEELRQFLITRGTITLDTPWVALKQATGGVAPNDGAPYDLLNIHWDTAGDHFIIIQNQELSTASDGVHFTGFSHRLIGQNAMYQAFLGRFSAYFEIVPDSGQGLMAYWSGTDLEWSEDLRVWNPYDPLPSSPFKLDASLSPARYYRAGQDRSLEIRLR